MHANRESRRAVVLDKSFLQGSSVALMHRLATSRRLLLTDSLFYELLSNGRDRAKCFAKFPPIENAATLVMHVGGYIRKEFSLRKASPLPSECALAGESFTLSPELAKPEFRPSEDALIAQAKKLAEVEAEMPGLIKLAKRMPQTFPNVFVGTQEARDAALMDAEAQIASDRDAILGIYSAMRSRAPKGERAPPPARYLTSEWFVYKWIQIRLLLSLDLAYRHPTALNEPMGAGTKVKVEHDLLDAEYLAIGAHEGGFATFEKKLQRWFVLVRPDGALLSKDGEFDK